MPQKEGDTACNEKKKFIGNDYITIVFNESGIPYKLGTIGGKFAYAAIEVSCCFLSASNNFSANFLCCN